MMPKPEKPRFVCHHGLIGETSPAKIEREA
jgi:hypothetical protein